MLTKRQKWSILLMISISFFLAVVIASCRIAPESPKHFDPTVNSRIKLVERTELRNHVYYIISVDGVEYLYVVEGGIIKLEKK